jgi:predicted AAA+ superfamily ATPase
MGVDSLICKYGVIIVRRKIEAVLRQTADSSKVVTITGPRQAGKTTLARAAFPSHTFYDMDNHLYQTRFQADPESFL